MTRRLWIALLLTAVSGCSGDNSVQPLLLPAEVDPLLASEVVIKFNGQVLDGKPLVLPLRKPIDASVSFRKGTVPITGKTGERTEFDKVFQWGGELAVMLNGSRTGQRTDWVGSTVHLTNGGSGAVWKSRRQQVFPPDTAGRYALTLCFSRSLGQTVTEDRLRVTEKFEYHVIYAGTVEFTESK